MLTKMLLACALALTASCASTRGSFAVPPPSSLMVPCRAPAGLPAGDMTQAKVEKYWGGDRDALRSCGAQLAGLVNWVTMQATKR